MPGPIKLPVSPDGAPPYSRLINDPETASDTSETLSNADAADIETASAIALDTTLQGSHGDGVAQGFMKRMRRKKGCCVCCGINCSLFCKALGLITLLIIIWNTIKFAKWVVTPAPTGLETMPAFSTSIGCLDAKHFFNSNTGNRLTTIPYNNASYGELSVKITGGAPGTITLTSGPAPNAADSDDEVYAVVVVRAAQSSYLNGVRLHAGSSTLLVGTPATPISDAAHCARFDMTLYIPPSLRALNIHSGAETQVKFDYPTGPAARVALDQLTITLRDTGSNNLVIGSAGLAAHKSRVRTAGGYVAGELAIASEASLQTTGTAVAKVDYFTVVIPNPNASDDWDAAIVNINAADNTDWNRARLSTSTTGQTTFSLSNSAHRPLRASHTSPASGSGSDAELRLDYKRAGFNGIVDVHSQGYSMSGVQSDGIGPNSKKWAGNKDGGDYLEVKTGGWVGLYF